MPFKETCRMESRIALMMDHDTGACSVAELCRRHGVSRQAFYEWKARRSSGEERWFEDRSHAVAHCPHAIEAAICEAVIALRLKFPYYGPKKLKAVLERQHPFGPAIGRSWPAASTLGDILKRAGLIEPASPRRTREELQAGITVEPSAANEEWAVDFKGYYRTRDGRRCDPLTISDTAIRYLIAIEIVAPRSAETRTAMERVFEELGLPDAIRCDNGQPLGSHGCGGLSPLSVWWLKLGIEPNYTKPASPQDNGRVVSKTRAFSMTAHAPHAEGSDGNDAGQGRGRAAGALRRLPPSLQRGAAARGARPNASCRALAAVAAPVAPAHRGAMVRRQS